LNISINFHFDALGCSEIVFPALFSPNFDIGSFFQIPVPLWSATAFDLLSAIIGAEFLAAIVGSFYFKRKKIK
jgi:hypothetical protein